MKFFAKSQYQFFITLILLVFCLLTFPSYGQEKSKNNFLEAKHESKLLAQEMAYRIILPKGYQTDANKRFPVIYLLHGRGGNYRDWTNLTKITEYSTAYNFIIVSADGGKESWYSDNVNLPNEKRESYIIQELIPEIDSKYRTLANRENRIIAGLSMGGYGAVKFGLKYPDKFFLAGSFSGSMDVLFKTEKYPWLSKSIPEVFGDEKNQARKDNDIFRIINEASPEKQKAFPFIFVDCGTEDHQFQSNRDFVALLTDKKIPHEYRQMPGEHNWKFWDAEIQEFLKVVTKYSQRDFLLGTDLPAKDVLQVADFNSKTKPNNLGEDFGTWNKDANDNTQGSQMSFANDDAIGKQNGGSLQLDYDVDSPNPAYNGFWMKLSKVNAEKLNLLSFYLKGDASKGFTAKIKIEVKFKNGSKETYMVDGITDKWQKFSIPLKFKDLKTDSLTEFTIVFDDIISNPKTGRILIDEIGFSSLKND